MKELFITCASGLESLLGQELELLGIKTRRGFCGVYAPQSMENVYRINYSSRIATRVLWPLIHFPCRDDRALYGYASEIDWPLYITPEKTFAIDSTVKHPLLRNSLYAAQVMKDALCDNLKKKFGSRPSVDTASPDVQFHLFIDKGKGTISIDTSGTPLFKRGYRIRPTVAPMQESLAAALLFGTHFKPQDILCDPFAGSGTFLIEAAMMATHTPPGFYRKKWGFVHMPQFSEGAWKKIKEEADSKIIPLEKGRIFGADKDPIAIESCRENIYAAGFERLIHVSCKEIKVYNPPCAPTFVLSNLPYGKRLEANEEIIGQLENFMKEKAAPEATCYFVSLPDLPYQKEFAFFNGGSKVNLYKI